MRLRKDYSIYDLEKGKCYCQKCLDGDKINILELDEEDPKFYKTPECGHADRYFSRLQWCDRCQDFKSRRGLSLEAMCYSCVCGTNSLKAMEKGIHSCQVFETSLKNPELHAKTIQAQYDNDSFYLNKPGVREKYMEIKKENYSKNKYYCARCGALDFLNMFSLCSKCNSDTAKDMVKKNKGPGKCSTCKVWNEVRDQNARGISHCNCSREWFTQCKYFNPIFTTINNVKFYKDKPLIQLVGDILSGKEDIANYPGFSVRYNRVCYHGRDVLTDEFLPINGYFTTIGGKLYYKQEPIEEIVDGLLDGTKLYTDYPNFNNRFGRICYKTVDVLTEEVIKLDGSLFITHNDVLHIQDFNGEYVPAEYFFNKQEERMNSNEISELTELLISTEGFTREPTICDLEEETWSSSRTDKYLCDKGYGWIVYIKLLDGKPFIVGKTGTKLVSASQIDFDFLVGDSKDERYCGAGRSLVRHMYPDRETTDFDSILVKAFEDENEALIYEQYIVNTYQLFQS